jgi:hypothetical protein
MSNILSYQMTLRSEFCAAMSATISAYKRLYLQLFVGELMSYLCYLICFGIVVSNTYCAVFCFICLRHGFCVPNVVSFSGLAILDCPFGFLYRLCTYMLDMMLTFLLG